MHIIALIDTELICLEHTLIVLRNNLQISIETEVRTHIGRILILLNYKIKLLSVYEVLIKINYFKNSFNSFNDFSFDDLRY